MKKFFCGILVLLTCSICFATGKAVFSWVSRNGSIHLGKIVVSGVPADGNTFTETFQWDGFIYRIVVDVNAVDSDGNLAATDTSGYSYINWENCLASGDISCATNISGFDSNNIAMGVPVSGTQTFTLVDCNAACPLTIWIYLKR